MKALGAFVALVALSGSAQAMSGGDLMQQCLSDNIALQLGCEAYLNGVKSGLIVAYKIEHSLGDHLCHINRPPTLENFVTWLRGHRDQLDRDAAELYTAAIWGCDGPKIQR